jgi:hypothetical protein
MPGFSAAALGKKSEAVGFADGRNTGMIGCGTAPLDAIVLQAASEDAQESFTVAPYCDARRTLSLDAVSASAMDAEDASLG